MGLLTEHRQNAGWANPREAVISAMKEYQTLGGQFIGDSQSGKVVENILETKGSTKARVVGVKTADGHIHQADQVVHAIGAFSTYNKTLLPGLDTQIHPTGFAVAHWKLDDPEELKAWENHPVVDVYHFGYFFPPDPTTGLMKLGLAIAGFTHEHQDEKYKSKVGIARANSALAGTPDEGRIPALAEDGIRSVLSRWAPSLAKKEFFDTKVCWDAMAPDGSWLIDHHPEVDGLCVASGGSGHGFKFLPVVGQYISEVLDIPVESEKALAAPRSPDERKTTMKQKWRWGRDTNMNVADRRVVLQGRPILDVVDCLKPGATQTMENMIRSKL